MVVQYSDSDEKALSACNQFPLLGWLAIRKYFITLKCSGGLFSSSCERTGCWKLLRCLKQEKVRIIFSSISTYIVPRPFCAQFDLCLQPYFLDGIQTSISIMILENLWRVSNTYSEIDKTCLLILSHHWKMFQTFLSDLMWVIFSLFLNSLNPIIILGCIFSLPLISLEWLKPPHLCAFKSR